ncbi:MAG: glycosyltransferase [Deltaproteobacteria bacterium]|nr:glycosyltransferase [Deltaproteobacteria bacterium]
MRLILVTNGLGYGGAERIVEALALDLNAAGERVTVVATTRDGPIGDSLRAAGIEVTVLGIKSPADARVPVALARVALARGAQLIHSHLAVSDIATAAAGLALPGVARVSTVHNRGVELDRLKLRLWHKALTRFHRVLPVSEAVQDSLPPGLPMEILRPSLIDPAAARPSRDEARAALRVPRDVPLVLAIGRLAPVKGFRRWPGPPRPARPRARCGAGEARSAPASCTGGGPSWWGPQRRRRDPARRRRRGVPVLLRGFPGAAHAMAAGAWWLPWWAGTRRSVPEQTGLLPRGSRPGRGPDRPRRWAQAQCPARAGVGGVAEAGSPAAMLARTWRWLMAVLVRTRAVPRQRAERRGLERYSTLAPRRSPGPISRDARSICPVQWSTDPLMGAWSRRRIPAPPAHADLRRGACLLDG